MVRRDTSIRLGKRIRVPEVAVCDEVLRGGVSIALVLAIGNSRYKDVLLEMIYFVVLFSIVVQGLTIGKASRKVFS